LSNVYYFNKPHTRNVKILCRLNGRLTDTDAEIYKTVKTWAFSRTCFLVAIWK